MQISSLQFEIFLLLFLVLQRYFLEQETQNQAKSVFCSELKKNNKEELNQWTSEEDQHVSLCLLIQSGPSDWHTEGVVFGSSVSCSLSWQIRDRELMWRCCCVSTHRASPVLLDGPQRSLRYPENCTAAKICYWEQTGFYLLKFHVISYKWKSVHSKLLCFRKMNLQPKEGSKEGTSALIYKRKKIEMMKLEIWGSHLTMLHLCLE